MTSAHLTLQEFGAAWRKFEAGDRASALADMRRAIANSPETAWGYLYLSLMLTHNERYRHEPDLCQRLVEDGTIAEALVAARMACQKADAGWAALLQAGYCLTALGRLDEATRFIRASTDMFCAETEPGLFAGLREDWQPLVPQFLIIGVAKAATTSLYHGMAQHPEVLPPVTKEIDFFGHPERGLDWYLAHFPSRPSWESRFVTGEGRVGNFDNPHVPALVKQVLPRAKLIVVLRDPVDRALSHYYNDRNIGAETRSLDEAMDEELSFLDGPMAEVAARRDEYLITQGHYLHLGLYALHIENWLKHFNSKDLLILISEELNADPKKEMRRVFKHIGLKDHPGLVYANKLPGSYDDQPKEAVRAKLARFFSGPNDLLYQMLGRRLNWRG